MILNTVDLHKLVIKYYTDYMTLSEMGAKIARPYNHPVPDLTVAQWEEINKVAEW